MYELQTSSNSGNGVNLEIISDKEVDLKPNQKIDVSKMQKFESLTTRKHYSGEHKVEVMINGTSVVSQAFTLSVD